MSRMLNTVYIEMCDRIFDKKNSGEINAREMVACIEKIDTDWVAISNEMARKMAGTHRGGTNILRDTLASDGRRALG